MSGLNARRVACLKTPGRYGDGQGLHLFVKPSGAKSWILRTVIQGRRRDIGLGSCRVVSLVEARDKARTYVKIAREGGDPVAELKGLTLTFGEAAEEVLKVQSKAWRNKKHTDNWMASLRKYAYPTLERKPLKDVTTADILFVLSPIWVEKHETATRLKQRLSTIFDWAKGFDYYRSENPLHGITRALPRIKPRVRHMPSMKWQDLPAFYDDLAKREALAARSLQFCILTVARPIEVREATWSEIEDDLWVIPGSRMKMGKTHRVPLTAEALKLLEPFRGLHERYVFPNPSGQPQSQAAMMGLLKRMGTSGVTVHGFRSTFRDWASESARADREVAELCLAHLVGNYVEQAYARSELLERRRELLNLWTQFVLGETGKIIQLGR